MAQITVTKLRLVEALEHFTGIAGVDVNAGDVVRFDGTTGKVVKAAADTAANATAVGVAVRTVKAGSAVTCLRRGVLDLADALDTLAYGAPVYLGTTPGTLDTAAGTVSVQVGQVIAQHTTAGPQRLLRVAL